MAKVQQKQTVKRYKSSWFYNALKNINNLFFNYLSSFIEGKGR